MYSFCFRPMCMHMCMCAIDRQRHLERDKSGQPIHLVYI